ncbi:MAG: arginine--tRNA ligase [Gimesia sp.]|uniref:Arginine--tRNA ligase n=1 Tax=Gimesia chilikensis TaxID=2605989 RepID=A0A517PTK4_9PLAN|nr:arginine--tRNA ligase [Gimesia chilikensis]MBN73929.1 arginine--tRNA ligase [Gimesia sp.]QDT22702.1 Arginine--tRNA ligase [Gimesia chilikensis]
MNILAELRSRFEPVLTEWTDNPSSVIDMLKASQDPKFGDYQANFAMPLAARIPDLKPRDLAAQIVEKVDLSDFCEPLEIAGPGFINIKLKQDWLQEQTMQLVQDERLGVVAVEAPQKVVVDFSAPNVAKPMHVGHLRSTVIGDANYRVLKFLGHDVVGDNHIGDWGTQFGMIIFGYKHFLNEAAFQEEPVFELARLYRLVNQLSDYHASKNSLPQKEQEIEQLTEKLQTLEGSADQTDKKVQKQLKKLKAELETKQKALSSLQESLSQLEANEDLKSKATAFPDIARLAREETAKLHAGDAENNDLWKQFLPQCLDLIQGVYDRLDIHFDMTLGESFYQPMLADVVADLKQKGLATESQGAICVFMKGKEAPFIVQKQDGAFTYATTDLATIKYRAEELNADRILYVVDSRQSEHFELLFSTVKDWGYTDLELQHVSFGSVLGEDGRPIKTRAGDSVGLDSLLNEAIQRAYNIVSEIDDDKHDGPELSKEERKQIAEVVGLGGIKYADLKHNRESDYRFDWDKMLAKQGDTATYMQYAYARVNGIFRKGGIDREELRTHQQSLNLIEPTEIALAMKINRYSEILESVAAEARPNYLTNYLYELADLFSTFYDVCPVLKADDETVRTSRLLLSDLTARVVQNGLSLLGIRTCERM